MQRVRVPTTGFSFGEVSPSLLSRTDSAVYASSAQKVENFLIRPEGGVTKRGGFKNVYEYGTTYDSTKKQQNRLIPFIFSDDEKYLISIEDAQLNIFKISPVDGTVSHIQTITQDVDAATLKFDDAYLHEYTYAQAGDVMFICHQTFMVQQIIRTSLTTFQVEEFVFATRSDDTSIYQPYFQFAAQGATLDPPASSGSGVTLTTSSDYFDTTGSLTGGDYLDSLHVGATIRYHGKEIDITSVQSATSVTGDIIDELYQDLLIDAFESIEGSAEIIATHLNHGMSVGDSITISHAGAVGNINSGQINGTRTISEVRSDDKYVFTAGTSATSSEVGGGTPRIVTHAASTQWDEQSFSKRRGYPAAVTFHENRLVFGGTISQPDGLWMSKSSKYYNFDVGDANDGDSISMVAAVGEISEIRHLVSNRDLQVFGATSELYVPAFSNNPITPTNAQIRRQTPYGSSFVRPVFLDGATVFGQIGGKVVREYIYTDTQAAYVAPPLSSLSSHLIVTPVQMSVSLGAADQVEAYAFIVNSDGTMAVLNSNRSEERIGWVEFTSAGKFVSVAGIEDRVFANVVFDTGAGTEKVFLCELSRDFDLDMANVYSGTAGVFNVSADFADGAVVSVTYNTHYFGDFTVASGTVTTSSTLTSAEIGYKFDVNLHSNPIDANIGFGPMTGRSRSLALVTLDLNEALSVSVNDTDLIIRQVTDDLSVPRVAVTGKREFRLMGYDSDPQVLISQSAPLPLQINGFISELVI